MVPLVGIMFGNVIGGITDCPCPMNLKCDDRRFLHGWRGIFPWLSAAGSSWFIWVVPLVIAAFVFANYFNIVGMGKDFSKILGVRYNLVLFMGLSIAAMITRIGR